MATPTIENYAKRIHLLEEQRPGEPVALGELAAALGITAGTVTTMVKSMAEAGLVEYQSRKGVTLTAQGRRLAHHVLRRHRIVELYLVEQLGMDWAEVHQEAEELEHSISDRVLQRMAAKLGDPQTDPHGSPIPTSQGTLPSLSDHIPLSSCQAGDHVTISHIRQQEAEFLHRLKKHKIMPGQRILVEALDPHAETVQCRKPGSRPLSLSLQKAERISVVLDSSA